MIKDRWKILLIEDDEDDFILTRDLLDEGMRGSFELEWVNSYEQALEALDRPHDVFLVDYRLGAHDGLEIIKAIVSRGASAPVILMTGQGSYDVDLEAMKVGATDYLSKNELTAPLLERSIRYAIERKQNELALLKAHDELEMRVQERTEELREANAVLRAEIAERKRAQEALVESEARFRKLAETTSSAIFIVHDGKIRYANPAARIITGYLTEELVQMHFWEIAHPAYQEIIKRRGIGNQWRAVQSDQSVQVPSRYELKVLTKQQKDRWIDVTVGQMDYEGMPALVVTAFDITERDLAEQALRKAKSELEERVAERTAELRQANDQLAQVNRQLTFELKERQRIAEEREQLLDAIANEQARLKTMIENAPEGIMVADSESRIVLANPAAERLFTRPIPYGKPVNEHSVLDLCYPDGRIVRSDDLPLNRAVRNGESMTNVEMAVRMPDGRFRQLLMNTAPIYAVEGDITGAIAILHDITLRKQEEEERRTHLARIEVQKRLMEHREKERLTIAQELHDGPVQELIGVTFTVNSVLDLVKNDTEPHLRLLTVQSALQKQIRELRTFSAELRPPTLAPFGLEKAIRSHTETVQSKMPQLKIDLDLYRDGKQLSESVRLALFRIYQEAMNNVIRHSKASQVNVSFTLNGEKALLKIEDDGCGFELPEDWIETARAGHFGLIGARERAEAIGAQIEIYSGKGSGTRIQVAAPLQATGA